MLRRTAWLLLSVQLSPACGGASPPARTQTTAATPTAAATPTGPTTPPAPPTPPALASAHDPACTAVIPYLNAMRSAAAQPSPNLASLRSAYVGTALQALIKASDAETGRTDDPALIAALAPPAGAGLPGPDGPGGDSRLAVQSADLLLHGALSQRMRHNLEVAVEDKDPVKRGAAWSAARCTWEQGLRPLALALPTRSAELSSETGRDDATIVADIDALFAAGAATLAAGPIDDRILKPGHETIEKTWFRVIHRALMTAATKAHQSGDLAAARRALGLFQLIRDRLQDRNTPGITIVEAILGGDPNKLDPAVVLREIDTALVKRARKYCSHALDTKLKGTPAFTSVTEGLAYTRILLPGMRAAIRDPAFDPEAHLATWSQLAEAAELADDPAELKKLSAELVHWNCAYQQTLGIRECTSTADEVAKPAKPAKP